MLDQTCQLTVGSGNHDLVLSDVPSLGSILTLKMDRVKTSINPDPWIRIPVLLKLASNGTPFAAVFNASGMLVQIPVRARVQGQVL